MDLQEELDKTGESIYMGKDIPKTKEEALIEGYEVEGGEE